MSQRILEDEIYTLKSKISVLEAKIDSITVSTITKPKLQSGNYNISGINTFSGTNTFTGSNNFTNLPTSTASPQNSDDLTNKNYVDTSISSSISKVNSNNGVNLPILYASFILSNKANIYTTEGMFNTFGFTNLDINTGFTMLLGGTEFHVPITGWYYYSLTIDVSNNNNIVSEVSPSSNLQSLFIPANTSGIYTLSGFVFLSANSDSFSFTVSQTLNINNPYYLTMFLVRESQT